jgi:hypothetical protein
MRCVGPGEGGDVAARVDNGHLAAILSRKGVVGQQFVEHLLGGQALPQ